MSTQATPPISVMALDKAMSEFGDVCSNKLFFSKCFSLSLQEVDPMQYMCFSYSDVASSGTEFLDVITPEEAASLVSGTLFSHSPH